MKTKRLAFTLIELLVVIAIIGLLATISVLALQNARAKSRDAKRVADIKQVSTALELFFNDNNRYPTAEEWNTGKIYSTTTGATSTYMQIIPNAPTPADGNCGDNQNAIGYIPSSDGTSYSISFCLGGNTGTLASGPKCLTPGGILDIDCSNSGPNNFVVSFGDLNYQAAYSVRQTSDGGYIIAGITNEHGNNEIYVVKIDNSGNKIWEKIYLSSENAYRLVSIKQTSDGGYIVATTMDHNAGDAYLLKIDASGNETWSNYFGQAGLWEGAQNVQQTSDGGYILTGVVMTATEGYDAYLLKVDSNGNETWNNHFGGTGYQGSYSVQQTSDGGYILAGQTFDTATSNHNTYMVKTDSSGNLTWEKDFENLGYKPANIVQQTFDGGYALIIGSDSNDGDAHIIKTDSSGNLTWEKNFGDYLYQSSNSGQQTSDGGYIMAGTNDINNYDAYLIKTDSSGNLTWEKNFGDSVYQEIYSVQQTSDGGYILAGETEANGGDFYIIKTDADGNVQ